MGTTIYPDKDLKKKLQEKSKAEMRSINKTILKILEDYFKGK